MPMPKRWLIFSWWLIDWLIDLMIEFFFAIVIAVFIVIIIAIDCFKSRRHPFLFVTVSINYNKILTIVCIKKTAGGCDFTGKMKWK